MIKVKLIHYTKDPEMTIASAARLCYWASSSDDLFKSISHKKAHELVKFLIESGHHSALEHASFTFVVEGISRACSHQLVRHRLASYSQQSQRYVAFQDDLEFVTPLKIEKKKKLNQRYQEMLDKIFSFYKEMIAEGIPQEDARYILPNAAETKIIITMNTRELFHSASLRLCQNAQWEIRKMFKEMKKEIATISLFIANYMEPKCIWDRYCSEKKPCDYVKKHSHKIIHKATLQENNG